MKLNYLEKLDWNVHDSTIVKVLKIPKHPSGSSFGIVLVFGRDNYGFPVIRSSSDIARQKFHKTNSGNNFKFINPVFFKSI